MTDALLKVRPLNVDEPIETFIPIVRDELKAAILSAGYNQTSVCEEMAVPYRTWQHWMRNGRMPSSAYAILAMVIGLPEPDDDVSVPRAPWVLLRRVEEIEDQLREVRAALGLPPTG